jgi:hypothetical protein
VGSSAPQVTSRVEIREHIEILVVIAGATEVAARPDSDHDGAAAVGTDHLGTVSLEDGQEIDAPIGSRAMEVGDPL